MILTNRIVRWSVIGLGLVLALQQAGQDVSAFLAGLGILGFTLGFALQDVSANFISGMLLLYEQPFNMGDLIDVAGYTGTVQDVDLRATELVMLDGRVVLIPNRDVFTNTITNFSRTDRRRISLEVGVAYDSDLKLVRQTALKAIRTVEGLLEDPEPRVVFNNFGDSAINFTLYYWFKTEDLDYFDATDVGITLIKTAFEEAGIDIPFPIRTVYMDKSK